MTTELKNAVLSELAIQIKAHEGDIIAANQADLAAYKGADASMYDRLKVDSSKVLSMIAAVEQAISLDDPEDRLLYAHTPENGLRIENRTVPFGKILIIYESRPDVTIEAAITAFKAGNKILLKGGKEAHRTNAVLVKCWHQALTNHNLTESWVVYLTLSRTETQELIKTNSERVDLIIPRGGEGLINFVKQNTNIPVIVSGRGNNFLFVDKAAKAEMAIQIILNGKSRISVCNALDKVLISEHLPNRSEFCKALVAALKANKIEIIGDEAIANRHSEIEKYEEEDVWEEEFLAPKILLGLVPNLETAIQKINQHSGGHSACVITEDQDIAKQFLREVDCAAVYHNASTRFTDGGQFGFGAEMAISTQKVHFRGPIGIGQLVTNKWFVHGTGQTR